MRFSSDKNMYMSSALACNLASTVTVEVLTTLELEAFVSAAALARTSPGGAGEYLVATGVAVPDSEEAMSFPCVATSCFGNSLNLEMRTGTNADWRNERKLEDVDDHSNCGWYRG